MSLSKHIEAARKRTENLVIEAEVKDRPVTQVQVNPSYDVQYHELRMAIDWLYNQSADMFLCGEIILIHDALKFLEDNPYLAKNLGTATALWESQIKVLFKHWEQITQNIMPAVELRIQRVKNALERLEQVKNPPKWLPQR
jgi:hypothetical protein